MNDVITQSIEDGVGIIELSRPDKFNCLSMAVLKGIDQARAEFEANPDVRAIMVRAQGKYFCTGADLDEVKRVKQNEDELDTFIGLGQDVLSRLESGPLPVIVAVQGLCLAGGLELMLAADICFAAETARIGDQHAQFGLIPGWGGSQRLTRILGLRRALDLFYSARWLTAPEAQTAGLVNQVVPDENLWSEAMAYCVKLTTRSRVGIAEMKRLAREGIEMSLADSIQLERVAAVRHIRSEDAAEGLDAFENGRTPEFKQ